MRGCFMSEHLKFFSISSSSLRLKEIKHLKLKVAGAGLLLGVCTIGLIYVINHYSHDIFGLASDKMVVLRRENNVLREQLRELSQEMDVVEQTIETLVDRGNQLRLVVDLKTIDDDTRAAAIGGSRQEVGFAFLGGEAGEILAECRQLIEKLTREVKLQQKSYEEIRRRYEYNTRLFRHIPAIKPMVGYYSINGFGMRIHPVLRVYRMHEGIDIINDVGAKVYAAGDGVVRYAGRTQGGYGSVIDISHGFGYSTLYAHLSKVVVRPGQNVKRGELMGFSGRSGLVSGPHLHYEIRFNGRKQNPVDYFFDDVDAARYRTLLASVK